jgi:recombination protein RecT
MEQSAVQVAAQKDPWMAQVVAQLDARSDQLASLLGSSGAVERFKTVALHTVVHDTGLRACDTLSIVEAIREAAVLNLEVYGPLGEAWILPQGKVARLSIGYRGLLKLIRQSELVAFVDAKIVYMEDQFDIELGTAPRILHRPLIFGERDKASGELLADRGNYRGAYAWAQLASSPMPLIEWMPLVDIEQVRKSSPAVRANKRSPWDDWYSEMARKSPLRRLAKWLPLSPLAAQALAYESETDELAERVHAPAIAAPRSGRDAALQALEARYPSGNGESKVIEPETAPLPAGEIPADGAIEPAPEGTPSQPEAQSGVSVDPKPAEVSRPPAPVEEDDDDLQALISRTELGGEG